MRYPKGHDFEYTLLRPSMLRTDPLYQRALDPHRVDRIAREFDGDIFNEPKVSYREGRYWIFDGQHGTAAWRKIHNGEDKPIYCKVYKGMTWLDECEAFVAQNGLAKDPTTNDKLRAAYNAKDPVVVDMVNRAQMCGFLVDFVVSKARGRIIATSALHMAYRLIGAETYSDMLLAIKEAWGDDPDAVTAPIIKGMATFYKKYWGNFSHDYLVTSLHKVSPAEIIRNGKSFSKRSNTYTREIVKAYNHRRTRNRLSEEDL